MIEKITAGVDWISASMHETAPEYHDWRARCYGILEKIAEGGYKLEARALLGYNGVSAGNCFFGEGVQGSFLQLTGAHANVWFDMAYAASCKFSRLDIQITAKYEEQNVTIAKEAYDAAIRSNEGLPIYRRRKLWIIVGSDGGDTFYLGSSSSEQRGRIYNKEVQSEDVAYTRCWRYEVVLRNDLSTGYARQRATFGPERAYRDVSFVVDWFDRRGVTVLGVQSGLVEVIPIERTRPTDVERKLRWLQEQVQPSVRYLLTVIDREAILLALGLTQ